MRTLVIAVLTPIAFILVHLAFVPIWILDAWALLRLWEWFVIPLGAPVIGPAEAAGIWVLASFLTHQVHIIKVEYLDGFKKQWLWNALKPITAVLVGMGIRGI